MLISRTSWSRDEEMNRVFSGTQPPKYGSQSVERYPQSCPITNESGTRGLTLFQNHWNYSFVKLWQEINWAGFLENPHSDLEDALVEYKTRSFRSTIVTSVAASTPSCCNVQGTDIYGTVDQRARPRRWQDVRIAASDLFA